MATSQKLYVMDLGCSPKHPVRTHSIMNPDGSEAEYKLTRTEPVEMPYLHGVKFLRDPAFHVADAEGNRLTPTPQAPAGPGPIQLEKDQVIARLDELTKHALAIRVAQAPGGHARKDAGKEDLIEFLANLGQKTSSKPAVGPDEIDPDAGIMKELETEIEYAPA